MVVGISAGGRAALALAERHPQVVSKLILLSSVSYDPWPDRRTRLAARFAFNPWMERFTWAAVRRLLHSKPQLALKVLLGDLTTRNPAEVVSQLSPVALDGMVRLVGSFRSGRGFLNDLGLAAGDPSKITAPTLIVHSRYDGAVSLHHPTVLAEQIPHARTLISDAASHLLWFDPHYEEIARIVTGFLTDRAPLDLD